MATASHAAPAPFGGTPSLTHMALPGQHIGSNYALAYGADGRVHVGGSEGLYTYDGRQWQVFKMPNGQLVRELADDGQRRLYTGGYNQFGYIEWDNRNQPQFTDFTQLFADELGDETFADIWQILINSDWVYFRGVRHLFAVNIRDLSHHLWRHEGRFGDLFHNGSDIVVQYRGEGLRYLNQDRFLAIPGTEHLTEQILAVLPVSGYADAHLILTRTGEWLTLTGNSAGYRVTPQQVPATLPASSEFSAWLALPHNVYAFGDNRGVLHILDLNEQTHQEFRIANDYISGLVNVEQGGLLAQTDSETIHVPWPSPWLKTAGDAGLSGSIQKLVSFADRWLTIGNAGVLQSGGVDSSFSALNWTNAEAWDWFELTPDRALLAESYVLKEVHNNTATTISRNDFYPRLIHRSRFDPSIFYIGTELGIAVMQNLDAHWVTLFVQENFIGRVLDIVETSPTTLILAVADHGLVKAEFLPGHHSLSTWQVLDGQLALSEYTRSDVRLSDLGHFGIVASRADGFWLLEDEHLVPTDLEGLASLVNAGDIFQVQKMQDDSLWAYSERQVFEWQADSGWHSHDLQAMTTGRINALGQLADGSLYVGGIASIVRYDSGRAHAVAAESPGVAIRSVVIRAPGGEDTAMPVDGSALYVPSRAHTLIIEYSPDQLPPPRIVQYQTTLIGAQRFDNDWDTSTRISYADLRPGRYEFTVVSRHNQGNPGPAQVLAFEVAPYWYQTTWAIALWLGAGLALSMALVNSFTRWRLARLRAERNRLRSMVEERTAELATANRKLEHIANLDALTGIANRRQLDHYLLECRERCASNQKPLGIVLIDVDHFKFYNDRYGHQRGDELLCTLATLLTTCLRRSEDMLARYGGEEFLAVLPGADMATLQSVAEDMRKTVESSALGIRISAGYASQIINSDAGLHALIGDADRRLYKAKENGRNQVVGEE